MILRELGSCLLIVALLLGAGCQNHKSSSPTTKPGSVSDRGDDHDATEVTVALADVPQPVRAGFDKAFPGAKVHKVEKETYRSGLVHWEFEFEHGGKHHEAEFDEEGELLPEH